MKHECTHCGEILDTLEVTDGPTLSTVYLNFSEKTEEKARLYVCTSRDCRNRGAVIVIPLVAKED